MGDHRGDTQAHVVSGGTTIEFSVCVCLKKGFHFLFCLFIRFLKRADN